MAENINIIITEPEPINIKTDNGSVYNMSKRDKIEASFSHTDFSEGSKIIGDIPGGATVEKTVVIIDEIFGSDSQITIGDSDAHGRLATVFDQDLNDINFFATESHKKFVSRTEARIYFTTGEPVAGSGKVIIYYNS